ncbi:glutathione S-transferase family protein [Phormidium tenue]|uniref:Glutathione S-transferase n=1 Tax=Phormidium tenue NIES-30 TaxID=549789 RepID=A0A1U7IZU9_9CYAN|nr:glutathione S-transferase family protein [Phormidium tenue]MBD2231695.1 glutathione S-transferase family protein [Phormidium tenue FACHB-1052]OKH44805.1 glutathione S-transferase [Phormidium tenue NIES-30]
MLTFYHTPLSVNSRRVWVALLEKNLPFEAIVMNLGGDQLQPEFLSLNPFHHIPVLVDDGFSVIESFAILDYLEAKYPTPSLLATTPEAVATMRMVEMVTVNELVPAINPLIKKMMGFGQESDDAIAQAKQKAEVVLKFYADKLADQSFFCGEQLTLADVVAGTFAPWFEQLGLPMTDYPTLQTWTSRLMERPAWQTTQPTARELAAFRDRMKERMAAQGQ